MSAPRLSEVLLNAIAQGVAGIRVCLPGKIRSFDKATQTAEVEPLIADQLLDGAGGVKSVALGVLSAVPVQFVGGGGFAETWPVAEGDPCLVVFGDRAIDDWYSSGRASTPAETRRHHESDAFAILGVRSEPGKLTEFDATRAVWGNKGPRFAADGNAVHLGVAHEENGTQDVVRGTKFTADLNSLLDTMNTAASGAQASLNTAGTAANAMTSTAPGSPVVGAQAVGAALIAAAAQLGQIPTAIATFKAQNTQHTTDKVKTP